MFKLIACLTMIIDHIGAIFFPSIIWFRIIGRLSMPLFAYGLARGFKYSLEKGTIKKYFRNLLIFAIISQIPYGMLFGSLNIGFTWIFALCLLCLREAKDEKGICLWVILLIIGLTLEQTLGMDYGLYGIMMPLAFYEGLFKNNSSKVVIINIVILNFIYWMGEGLGFYPALQFISMLSLIIILKFNKFDSFIKLPKWFYYVIYPLHLLVFGFIQAIL